MGNPLLDPNARLVIGHRGNRVLSPENTTEGMRSALEVGADAVEFDVRLTRDGVPVLMHDPTIDRTTNGRGPLRAFTAHEALAYRVLGPPAASGSPDAPIPTLETVLDVLREAPMVIEVKELDAVDAVVRLVERFGAQDRIVLGSSQTAVSERLYASGLRACASMRDALRIIPAALLGRPPAPGNYAVLSITPRYLGAPIPVVRMADAARKIGVPTHAWTVNDTEVALRFWHGGVAGIVTDDPAAMVRARRR